MNQEKFINSYIDLLNSTLTEAIQKNLTILAQKNVIESDYTELRSKIDEENELLKKNIIQRDEEINALKNQLNDARKQKEMATFESNELKKSAQHVDTFKNELIKTREETKKLSDELNKKNLEIEKLNNELNKKNLEIEKLNEDNANLSSLPILTKPLKKPVRKNVEEMAVKDAGNF